MNAHLIIFFLTHSHYDHALGSAYILRHYPNAKVVAGKYAVDIFKRDGTKIISYYQKKRSEGKHHLVATNAVARKLCHTIFAVLKNNTPLPIR